MSELDELAYTYGWEKWGDGFVYSKSGGEFYLSRDEFYFACACCSRKAVIKTGLTDPQIKNIIKSLGLNNE